MQQLVGTNWREPKTATLQAIPLRPGGLPGVIMVAGLRQAHMVSHQGHTMASLPLAVTPCAGVAGRPCVCWYPCCALLVLKLAGTCKAII